MIQEQQENFDETYFYNKIEFGTGKLYYAYPKTGQTIEVQQLIEAIKNIAMVVPLNKLINTINDLNRF